MRGLRRADWEPRTIDRMSTEADADALQLTVFSPAYNEEECIERLVREIAAACDGVDRRYEILIIDDGSSDRTFEILRGLCDEFPQLRVLRLAQNTGLSAGFDAGFQNARGEIVISLDADLQNDPADIPKLLEKMDEFDVVCGIRAKREDNFIRRASSRIANGVRNWYTHESVQDIACSLKAFRRRDVARLKMFKGLHRFLPTLLRLQGCRVTEIPVNHRPRTTGVAKYGVWNRVFRAFRDMLVVRWMQQRWIQYEIAEELPAWPPTRRPDES
jgi:glycosyltransferase involved in cell wall biosynthesis